MPKTHRIKNSNNKTKKCPVGLKPFEKNFSLVLAKNEKKLNNIETYKKAEFARELFARFAPQVLNRITIFMIILIIYG